MLEKSAAAAAADTVVVECTARLVETELVEMEHLLDQRISLALVEVANVFVDEKDASVQEYPCTAEMHCSFPELHDEPRQEVMVYGHWLDVNAFRVAKLKVEG